MKAPFRNRCGVRIVWSRARPSQLFKSSLYCVSRPPPLRGNMGIKQFHALLPCALWVLIPQCNQNLVILIEPRKTFLVTHLELVDAMIRTMRKRSSCIY